MSVFRTGPRSKESDKDMEPFGKYICPLDPATAQAGADPFGLSDADLTRLKRFDELPLSGLEGGVLAGILLGVRARGASDDDVCEYIAAPHDRLPLVGIEREMLDRLLAVMVERGARGEQLIESIREASPLLGRIVTVLIRTTWTAVAGSDGCDATEHAGGRHGVDFAAQ